MRTIACALYTILYTFITYPIRISYKVRNMRKSEREQKVYKLLRRLVLTNLKICGIYIDLEGIENKGDEEPYLIVSNHKSLLDCLVLIAIMDEPLIFIGKKEIKNVPIISGWFKDIGCLFIDRDNVRQGMKTILKGVDVLKSGKSVIIFPEGKIILENKLGEFKLGSFKMALKAKVKVLPISIGNLYKLLEEKKKVVKGTAYIVIGKVIDWTNNGCEKTEQLRDCVVSEINTNFEKISEQLEEIAS